MLRALAPEACVIAAPENSTCRKAEAFKFTAHRPQAYCLRAAATTKEADGLGGLLRAPVAYDRSMTAARLVASQHWGCPTVVAPVQALVEVS